MSNIPVHIRQPDHDETPLSSDERLIAIREGFHTTEPERWHPAIVRNWSVMSAKLHRTAAIAASSAPARVSEVRTAVRAEGALSQYGGPREQSQTSALAKPYFGASA